MMSGAQMPAFVAHGGSATNSSTGFVHGPDASGAVDSCRPEPVGNASNWLSLRNTPGSSIGYGDTGCGVAAQLAAGSRIATTVHVTTAMANLTRPRVRIDSPS